MNAKAQGRLPFIFLYMSDFPSLPAQRSPHCKPSDNQPAQLPGVANTPHRVFPRESQYLTGLIMCLLAQAAHFETDASRRRHKRQPARCRVQRAGYEGKQWAHSPRTVSGSCRVATSIAALFLCLVLLPAPGVQTCACMTANLCKTLEAKPQPCHSSMVSVLEGTVLRHLRGDQEHTQYHPHSSSKVLTWIIMWKVTQEPPS